MIYFKTTKYITPSCLFDHLHATQYVPVVIMDDTEARRLIEFICAKKMGKILHELGNDRNIHMIETNNYRKHQYSIAIRG